MVGCVLITGASGFIGRHAVVYLAAAGWQVRAVSRKASATSAQANVEWMPIGDLTLLSPTDWARATTGCDAVLHLAGRAHVMAESAADPRAAFDAVNVAASLSLARAARATGVRRMVFVSSIGVHGVESVTPFNEGSPLVPVEPYAASKLAGERALAAEAAGSGLELVFVRPPLVYGPHCPGNLARLVKVLQRGWPLPLAAVTNRRSFIGVRNLVSLLAATLTHPGAAANTFVAADGQDVSLPQLLQMLAAAWGRRAALFALPPALLAAAARVTGQERIWRKLAGDLQVDATHARTHLQWLPEVTLEDGLRETALSFAPALGRARDNS